MNSNTGVDWRTFYREVCESALGEQKVTGEERILVEIGEKHFGRRKYNKDRDLSEICVLGGLERENGRCFLVALADDSEAGTRRRDAATLKSLIQKYARHGSE